MRATIAVLTAAALFCTFTPHLATAQIIDDVIIFGLQSRAFGINEDGSYPLLVCGEAQDGMGVWRAAAWSNDGVGGWVLELLPGIAPGKPARANAASNKCDLQSVEPLTCGFAYDGLDRLRPVVWRKTGGGWMLTPLPTFGGPNGEALGLACDADFEYFLVGWFTNVPVLSPRAGAGMASPVQEYRQATAWTWKPDVGLPTARALPDYDPTFESRANGVTYDPVNHRLYATGFAENFSGNRMAQVWVSANAGTLWTRVELPAPPGGAAYTLGSDAGCGNNRVYVTGWAGIGGVDHPVAWESLDMGMTWMAMDLGVPAGYTSAVGFTGTTIGDLGDFWVGAAADAQGMREAAYWYDDMGNIVSGPLSDIVLFGQTVAHLSEARAADRHGRVAGWGLVEVPPPAGSGAFAQADTDTVAFVLIPASGTPATDTPVLEAQLEAHPNPFNPTVRIAYQVPVAGNVTVSVYDVAGREVARLFDGHVHAGERSTTQWHGKDSRGNAMGSGVYFVRLSGGGVDLSRKIVLLK